MTTITVPEVTRAMGGRSGDYLDLENQWASVRIWKDAPNVYGVGGADGDLSQHRRLSDAVCRALAILATYQRGRVS